MTFHLCFSYDFYNWIISVIKLTDFKLSFYSFHIPVSVVSLKIIAVTHQVNKVAWQDGMLEEVKKKTWEEQQGD